MENMNKYLRKTNTGLIMFWCPGCQCGHYVNDTGDLNDISGLPTIRPSILVKSTNDSDEWEKDENGDFIFENGKAKGSRKTVCHLFVTDGVIEYLPDSTHSLAGKSVPMEKF